MKMMPSLIISVASSSFLFSSIYPDSKTQRTQGRQAQLGNINAARAVADIIRSTLGPRSMLKVRQTHAHRSWSFEKYYVQDK
jgi:hypothetical protein